MPAKKKNRYDTRNIPLSLKVSQTAKDKIDREMRATNSRSVNDYVINAIEAYNPTGAAVDAIIEETIEVRNLAERLGLISHLGSAVNTLVNIAVAAMQKVIDNELSKMEAITRASEVVLKSCGARWYPLIPWDRLEGVNSKDELAYYALKLRWANVAPCPPPEVISLDDAMAMMSEATADSSVVQDIAEVVEEASEMPVNKEVLEPEALELTITDTVTTGFEYPLLIVSKRYPADYAECLERHLQSLGGELPKCSNNSYLRQLRQAIAKHGGKVDDYDKAKAPFGRFHVANSRRQEWLDHTREEQTNLAAEYDAKLLAPAAV
jgi:hypothetical protein